MAKKTTVKRKKTVLTPQEKEQRAHVKEIQDIFLKIGFSRVPNVADKQIEFKDRKGDFDDIFVYKNIIVLSEYTITKSGSLSDHLLPKKVLYDLIQNNKTEFIEYLKERFPSFKNELGDYYTVDHYKIVQIYCSKNYLNKEHKVHFPYLVFFDYQIVKYFKEVSNRIKLSARFELFNFFKLVSEDIGENVFSNLADYSKVAGTVLPESSSNFKKGYKVVSFYIAPSDLLEKAYVLRQDGWNDSFGLYQRMLVKKKMGSIRDYLVNEKRVFINNLLVTLPSDTKIIDNKGIVVDPSTLVRTQPVEIQIPNRYNTVGLIDGQHRVYAYHEDVSTSPSEKIISQLRIQQNMLVSGIIYPEGISQQEKTEFEAKLFLEINSNQANAKSELKQKIGLLLRPFSSESIARSIVMKLNEEGPLLDIFETSFFDKDKVKTTSIVSFGLKSLIKLSGTDSMYHLWTNKDKEELLKNENSKLLDEYKSFCTEQINNFFIPIKRITSLSNNWTSDRKNDNRVLSTTVINGFIICLRRLIANGKVGDQEYYMKQLAPISEFSFNEFKSSQYSKLADKLYKECFES